MEIAEGDVVSIEALVLEASGPYITIRIEEGDGDTSVLTVKEAFLTLVRPGPAKIGDKVVRCNGDETVLTVIGEHEGTLWLKYANGNFAYAATTSVVVVDRA